MPRAASLSYPLLSASCSVRVLDRSRCCMSLSLWFHDPIIVDVVSLTLFHAVDVV
ncbi:MAG: hypothetical protein ACK55Z_15485 [bacterium]